jgi:hypothetical protein
VGTNMKKLLNHIVYTASLLMFATQASAWVSKQFIPSNVSLITVVIEDNANDGCWTNIGEVKRYTEDKLELAGFKVSREKFESYEDEKHYLLGVTVTSSRNGAKCYGGIQLYMFTGSWANNVGGLLYVGKQGGTFTQYDNANQLALRYVSKFMKEVEDPQW